MVFADLINNALAVFQAMIGLIFALALTYFLYGIVKYIVKYGDETARRESIKVMTYGIIALFVMVSVWGLVGLLVNFIGNEAVGIPQIKL